MTKSTNAPAKIEVSHTLVPFSCTSYGYVLVEASSDATESELLGLACAKYEACEYVEQDEEAKPDWELESVELVNPNDC